MASWLIVIVFAIVFTAIIAFGIFASSRWGYRLLPLEGEFMQAKVEIFGLDLACTEMTEFRQADGLPSDTQCPNKASTLEVWRVVGGLGDARLLCRFHTPRKRNRRIHRQYLKVVTPDVAAMLRARFESFEDQRCR